MQTKHCKKMSNFVCLQSKYLIFYTIIVVLALQGHQFEAKRVLDIYATLFSYVLPRESAIVQANCSLTSIAEMLNNGTAKSKQKTHSAIYFSAKFAYDITDVKVNLNISIARGGRYDSYLTTTIDLCEIRYSKVAIPIIRYLRDELIRVVKPKEFCPIKKNDLFEVNNFMLSNINLPPYAPSLNWRVDAKLWLNGQYSAALLEIGKIEWINI